MTSARVPVTVAVAACDRPAGVVRCLTALLAGEALPAEIVVVDQSSDRSVAEALAGMPAPAVPVRHLTQARRGLSASRNRAVGAAGQPVVAFTDDDCVPSAGWVATVGRVLAADERLAGVTGRVLPLGEERPGTYVVSPRTSTAARTFRGRAVPWRVGTGGNFAARRAWLERVNGFDERLGAGAPGRAAEDADVFYRLLRLGAVIRYEPDAVVYHERQTLAQRLAARTNYGFGIGTLCGMWLRRGDPYAMLMLGSWLSRTSSALLRAAAGGQWFMVRQRALSLRGGGRGLIHGLRLP